MKNKLTEIEVLDRHRDIFREYWDPNMTEIETCMFWGLEVLDDWLPAIDTLCTKLEEIEKEDGVLIVAEQVKSKFNMLRFYYRVDIDKESERTHTCVDTCGKISKAIDEAEKECARVT